MSRRASVVNKHYSSPRKESLSADGGGDWVGCGVLPGYLREVRVLYKQPAFTTRVYAIAMHLFYFILWDGSLRSLRVSAGASYLILLHTLVCTVLIYPFWHLLFRFRFLLFPFLFVVFLPCFCFYALVVCMYGHHI